MLRGHPASHLAVEVRSGRRRLAVKAVKRRQPHEVNSLTAWPDWVSRSRADRVRWFSSATMQGSPAWSSGGWRAHARTRCPIGEPGVSRPNGSVTGPCRSRRSGALRGEGDGSRSHWLDRGHRGSPAGAGAARGPVGRAPRSIPAPGAGLRRLHMSFSVSHVVDRGDGPGVRDWPRPGGSVPPGS